MYNLYQANWGIITTETNCRGNYCNNEVNIYVTLITSCLWKK